MDYGSTTIQSELGLLRRNSDPLVGAKRHTCVNRLRWLGRFALLAFVASITSPELVADQVYPPPGTINTPENAGGTATIAGQVTITASGSLEATNVIISSGGTLILSGNTADTHLVNGPGNPAMTFDGGILQIDSASSLSETMGVLTLSSNSAIDFGTGAGTSLTFADSSGATWSGNLYIYNYSAGDHLSFESQGLTGPQLNQIYFAFDDGAGGFSYQNGAFALGTDEVSPVPEPSSILIGVGLIGMVGWRERKRFTGLFGATL